jgi:putative spermidine/putrescine transport system ATP-binding protein
LTLALEQLDVPFGAHPGLARVSLALAPGERVALVGASGSGKTSLLRAIAGLGPVTHGSIRIGDTDVTALPPHRRDAVYLQQTPLLFPHMNVADNVAFPLRIRGLMRPERLRRAAEALESVRLGGYGLRMPHTLSGGQRHRAALARAVVARPKALLLDEPLTGLDPSLRNEVRDALLAVHREYQPALLLVTHDLDEAALIADRIGVLLDGRLDRIGAPAELLTFPGSLAVARFLGGFVELPGTYRNGVFESQLGSFSVARPPEREGAATALIRNDAVRLDAQGPGGFPVRVQAVRVLARRMQVTVVAGDTMIELTVGTGAAPRAGDEVRLVIPPEFAAAVAPGPPSCAGPPRIVV